MAYNMKKIAPFILILILFIAVGWYFLVKEPDPVHEVAPSHSPPALPVEVPQVAQQPEKVTGDAKPKPVIARDPLPPLNESDVGFTGALVEVAGEDQVDEFLVRDQVISRTVAMIDSLISRQVPAQVNPVRSVEETFVTETQGDRIVMSVENFARYDGYVALIGNTDTNTLMKVYRRHYPLFQEAWRENGGEGPFKNRLIEVIDNLLDTPDVPGPVYLTKPEAVYLFEDPELEAMTAGQKILVRMGSVNASVVKEKLMEIRVILKPKG